MKILHNILGTRAKVAVLREVSLRPGVTARQIAENSEMAWGSIRPAVAQLREARVVRSENGRWSNGLFLNEDHVMSRAIKRLFTAEAESFSLFVSMICKRVIAGDAGLVSVLASEARKCVVVVTENGMEDERGALCGLASGLGIKLLFMSPEEFNEKMGENAGEFRVASGEKPPFATIRKGLSFFGLGEDF